MDVTHEHRIGGALVLALVSLLVCLFCLQASSASADELSASNGLTATAATASTSSSASSASDSASSSSSSTDEGASSSVSSSASASASSASSTEDSSPSTSSTANEEVATAELMATTANAPLAANVVAATAASTDGTVTILYDEATEIHYVLDPDSANGRIILYCMNNASHWPHTTPSIPTVPSYIEGYLSADKFSSQADYEACMSKLLAILYAGYPYNGMNMYEVVDTVTGITEDKFNAMLTVPDVLRTDFPDTIGNEVFSYDDYTTNNTDHLNRLNEFIQQVTLMKIKGTTSASGLTADQIQSMEFYQAALCMAWSNSYGTTPLGMYDALHSGEYYVTEAQAYEATQYAIWAVLGDYGIEYNTLTSSSSDVTSKALAVKLLNYATADRVLRAEPDASNVSISGDAQFAYDPASGTWKTGALKITEGTNYNGRYALTLPDGVTAQTANGTEITSIAAGTSFYLVSSTKPTSTDMEVKATDTLTWLQEYRQYSPNPENYTASDGKNFQHMIGAVIKQKDVSASLALKPAKDGNLTVSKAVVGEANSQTAFTFTVTLGDKTVNGTYGDMAFTNGVATVTLKGGQSATATYLPGGTTYTVTEAANNDYAASSGTLTGTVPSDGTAATAAFTNTRLYKLTLSKTVSGRAASTSQAFTLHVTLKDASGNPLSGTYSYTGGTVADSGATAPADGTITLDANGTGTVALAAGQQVTIAGIPSGTAYTVEEVASTATDEPLYDATYNGSATPASGKLSADATVAVTNTVQEGSLSVTKHVTGEVGSTQAFTFTVKLGGVGANLSGQYGDMLFANGEATFTLKDGETKTASALPAGATYEVVEESNSKYTTTSENATGEITKGGTAAVSFTNTRGTTSLPLSGQAGIGALFMAGAALLAIAAVRIHRRRARLATKGGDADER